MADLTLNSGAPEGIFAVLDLFTVNGFLTAFSFYILQTVIRSMLEMLATLIAFLLWYSVDEQLPLCAPG